MVLYDYGPGRNAEVPIRLLGDFKGYLQADAYSGYNAVVAANGLTRLGCMAHARRKFTDAIKAQGKNKKRGEAHPEHVNLLWTVISKITSISRSQRLSASGN